MIFDWSFNYESLASELSYHQVTPLITIRVIHYPDYVYRAQSGPDHVPSPALQHFRGLRHLLRYYAIQLS
jgi:hypothetical protein